MLIHQSAFSRSLEAMASKTLKKSQECVPVHENHLVPASAIRKNAGPLP